MDRSWEEDYVVCPRWGRWWRQALAGGVDGSWPKGVQLYEHPAAGVRMLWQGRTCVPTKLTALVLAAHHEAAGHPARDRLWKEAERHFHFADPAAAKRMTRRTMAKCVRCQAAEPAHWRREGPLRPAPVPPRLMDHVALDLLKLLEEV